MKEGINMNNLDMDQHVIKWFKSQFDENNNIKNITYYIGRYTDKIYLFKEKNKCERMQNILKIIRQDLAKISTTLDRMEWLLKESNKKNENFAYLNGLSIFDPDRKLDFQTIDIEYFLVKYRSVIDYSIDFLLEFFPEISKQKKYQIEKKTEYLKNIFSEFEIMQKNIFYSDWHSQVRLIRNSIIHAGTTCYTFAPEKDEDPNQILFQIYDSNLDERIFESDSFKYNENIYDFKKTCALYMAYLYFYLDTLFKSIICKNEKISFKTLENKLIQIYNEHKDNLFLNSTYSLVLKSWIDQC